MATATSTPARLKLTPTHRFCTDLAAIQGKSKHQFSLSCRGSQRSGWQDPLHGSNRPSWAPLFPSVGILVERGSTSPTPQLSRESRIPAVVNIPGLTELLDDKEEVTMDGDLGTVERSNV